MRVSSHLDLTAQMTSLPNTNAFVLLYGLRRDSQAILYIALAFYVCLF